MLLNGNTVLITGGSSGIGLELTRELVKRGNTVIITGRDQAKLDKCKQEIPALHVIRSDVGQPAEIEALHARVLKEFPKLNVLVNNAGIMRTINLHKDDSGFGDLVREIGINLSGPILMVQKFLPHLKSMDNAAIVNVSSGLAFVPLPTSPIYCATKAALHSYTQSLRVQMKNTKVKIFELCPPATETELLTSTSDAEDLKGVSVMAVGDLIRATLKGLENDELEIRPGQSNQLRFMNRVAPGFILAQLSKPVDRMLQK